MLFRSFFATLLPRPTDNADSAYESPSAVAASFPSLTTATPTTEQLMYQNITQQLMQALMASNLNFVKAFTDADLIKHKMAQLKVPVLSELSKTGVRNWNFAVERYLKELKKISSTITIPSIHSLIGNDDLTQLINSHFARRFTSLSPDSLFFTEYFDIL